MNALTIVVPFYNNATLINRLAESLMHQINKNFKLVLVSDGASKKNCDYVLNKVAGLKNVVLYRASKHLGVAKACNFGFKKVKTEWVVFLDVDDYVSTNFVSCFYKAIIKSPSLNLVISEFVEVYPNHKLKKKKTEIKKYKFFTGHRGNKFYRKSSVKALFLEGLSLGEDTLFYLEYLQNNIHLQKITAQYFYVRRSWSSYQVLSQEKILNIWKSYSYLKKKYDLKKLCNLYLLEFVYKHLYLYTYIRLKLGGCNNLKKYRANVKKAGPIKILTKSGWQVFVLSCFFKFKLYFVVNLTIKIYKIYFGKTRFANKKR